MRIPNTRKLKVNDFDNRLYEVRSLVKADPLSSDLKFGFLDEKKKQSFITGVERMIRGSLEYKQFISFLKDELDMDECTFYSKFKNKMKNISIEIHHEPFSLFDLVYICINYFMEEGYEIEDFSIAEEVMRWHYCGFIGLIPLSKTVHELVHKGQIFIPIHFPYGNISEFYKEFGSYMTDTQREVFATIVEQSKVFKDEPPEVLKKRFVYLSIDGFSLPESV